MQKFLGYTTGLLSFVFMILCAGFVEAFNIAAAVVCVVLFGVFAKLSEKIFGELSE